MSTKRKKRCYDDEDGEHVRKLKLQCGVRKVPFRLDANFDEVAGKWTAWMNVVKCPIKGDYEGCYMLRSDKLPSRYEALENLAAKVLARWKKNRVERLSLVLRDWMLAESKRYTFHATVMDIEEMREAMCATFFQPLQLDEETNAECKWLLSDALQKPFASD